MWTSPSRGLSKYYYYITNIKSKWLMQFNFWAILIYIFHLYFSEFVKLSSKSSLLNGCHNFPNRTQEEIQGGSRQITDRNSEKYKWKIFWDWELVVVTKLPKGSLLHKCKGYLFLVCQGFNKTIIFFKRKRKNKHTYHATWAFKGLMKTTIFLRQGSTKVFFWSSRARRF